MKDVNIYLNNFTGINNLVDAKDLTNNDLVDAVNIDITRDGRVESRPSWKYIRECLDGHSLFSDNVNKYFIDGDNLYKRDINGNEEIIDIGYKNLKTSYIKDINCIIISNDKFIKRYKNNKIYDIAPPIITNEYKITLGNNGNFPVGRYQIAMTFIYDDGIEGPTRNSINFDIINDQSSVSITNLAESFDTNIVSYRLYLTEQNSTTLRYYNEYPIGTNIINLTYNPLNFGKSLTTFNKAPLHAGSLIEKYKGVIFTAFENKIYLSDPLQYLTAGHYLEFDGEITCLLAQIDGIYVSDEYNVYWLGGENPMDLTRTLIYNSPAVKYTQNKNIMTNECFFFTQMGQIVAKAGGQIQNITSNRFKPDNELLEGASLVMYQNGLQKIINTFKKGQENSAAFGDWAKIV